MDSLNMFDDAFMDSLNMFDDAFTHWTCLMMCSWTHWTCLMMRSWTHWTYLMMHSLIEHVWWCAHGLIEHVWWCVHGLIEHVWWCIQTVKFVFETFGQVKFEVNLNDTFDCVSTPYETIMTSSTTLVNRGGMVFNTTLDNISVISWRSVLLVEEIRVTEITTDLSILSYSKNKFLPDLEVW